MSLLVALNHRDSDQRASASHLGAAFTRIRGFSCPRLICASLSGSVAALTSSINANTFNAQRSPRTSFVDEPQIVRSCKASWHGAGANPQNLITPKTHLKNFSPDRYLSRTPGRTGIGYSLVPEWQGQCRSSVVQADDDWRVADEAFCTEFCIIRTSDSRTSMKNLSAVGISPFRQKGPTLNDSQTDVFCTPHRFHTRCPCGADCGVVRPESQIAASGCLDKPVLEADLRRETSAIILAAFSEFVFSSAAVAVLAADRPCNCRSVSFPAVAG